MADWSDKQVIYEVNTWVWLNDLRRAYHAPAMTLADVPDAALDALAKPGIDMIWLMGIWQRSQAARRHALRWKHEYRPALPDMTDDDVIGSAYAIADYRVDDRLGGREALAVLRERLAARGVKIMLDFVPNHVAVDHPWVDQPGFIIVGTPQDLKRRPNDFFVHNTTHGYEVVLAHGRDPFFSGWADTAQLNLFNPELRKAVIRTLADIAEQCDGVRCDMAMLVMNDIFAETWRGFVDEAPRRDFWLDVIPRIRARFPEFVFVAEVYWGKEYDLLNQGFDYCYDKVFYDRLMDNDAQALHRHLAGTLDFGHRLMRFIENHDEARAFDRLGTLRSAVSAALLLTMPGGTLLHDGQFTGRIVKLPVQIARAPIEREHADLETYYARLLEEITHPVYHVGQFSLFNVKPANPQDHTFHNLLAYGWHSADGEFRLIVLNLTGQRASGRVRLAGWEALLDGQDWAMYDCYDGATYSRSGSEMAHGDGLFVSLEPYRGHIFHLAPAGAVLKQAATA